MGVKITPYSTYNDISESKPIELYTYFLEELSKRGILFVECTGDKYTSETKE